MLEQKLKTEALKAFGTANHEQHPMVFAFANGQQTLTYYEHPGDDERHNTGNYNRTRTEIDLTGQNIPTTGKLAVETYRLLEDLRALSDDYPSIGEIEVTAISIGVVTDLFNKYAPAPA